jgi:hypothetical protein
MINLERRNNYSAELLLAKTNETLEFVNSALKLEQTSVLGIAVSLHHVHLSVDSFIFYSLLSVGTLDFLF